MTSPQGRKPPAHAPVNLNDPDNPEWTEEDFAKARPGAEVLPQEVLNLFGKRRGRPKVEAPKQSVHLRLSPRVVEHFKREGSDGWQKRLNAALEAIVDRGRP
jgi:uncharacterized protein (DUF4415 family)